MASIEAEYHRTLVDLLAAGDHRELAAVMIDGGVSLLREYDQDGTPYGLSIDVPASAYEMVNGDPELSQTLLAAGKAVAAGHFFNGNGYVVDDPTVRLRIKRMAVEAGWQNVVREMIVNSKGNNQGTISRLMFRRRGTGEMLTYNEASFASKSEIRIAQELETRQVLFFPLAMAVRADTGEFWRDHKEADFLICNDGVWGVLEVSYHPNRFEKDKEKDIWWKKSGILCVEHYTAEKCFREPGRVVDEFLNVLAKHRR